MTGNSLVRAVLRNRSEVLLQRGDDTDRWATISGPADTDPERAARREVLAGTELSPAEFQLVRSGDPFACSLDSENCTVHPFLFECEHREVGLGTDTAHTEWLPPTAILSRRTVPGLWRTYDGVRPTVETVEDDTDHGSTRIAIRALAVLRDEAGIAVHGRETTETDDADSDESAVADVAHELLAARPSMTAVANRVHRAMAAAGEPADVVTTAHEGIDRARRVDREAATAGAEFVGDHVATLSRSGTVRELLAAADPARVLVAESRPGREGVDAAVDLEIGDGNPAVTLTTDAAFAAEFAARGVETLLVGADAVLADGRVVNKAGTRAAALAAAHEGISVVVVAASDKISPGGEYDPEERDPSEVYDGDAPVSVANPTFDVTPATAIDTVVTERGALDTGDVEAIAAEHRSLREWDRE
jgi:translation initiation factor 2B subunit (eIF-2B alpha/beta/delta family)